MLKFSLMKAKWRNVLGLGPKEEHEISKNSFSEAAYVPHTHVDIFFFHFLG